MACGAGTGHVINLIGITIAGFVGVGGGEYNVRFIDAVDGIGASLSNSFVISIGRGWQVKAILEEGVVCHHFFLRCSASLCFTREVDVNVM